MGRERILGLTLGLTREVILGTILPLVRILLSMVQGTDQTKIRLILLSIRRTALANH